MECFGIDHLKMIEGIMSVFFEATSLPCSLIDSDGDEVLCSNIKTAFCANFRKSAVNDKACLQSHQSSGRHSETIDETYISFCQCGLALFTRAIFIEGDYAGALVVGPVLFDMPDIYLFRKLMDRTDTLGANMALLEMHYNQVTLMGVEKARRIRELIDILTRDLHRRLAQMDTEQEGDRDSAATNTRLHTDEKYPIHLEKDLTHYIRHSNKLGVRKAINEILGYIYLRCEADYREVMMMVLQVVVLMSRAAVDVGVSYDALTAHINSFIGVINDENSSEGAYERVSELLDAVVGAIFPESALEKGDRLVAQKITSYIQNNYNTGLTLEEVASYVNMNPSYLSRFFKKELGTNFSDYVNNIRVEYSKEYLENDGYSIIDIALMMGFTDQSYYSKVFKKYAGMTPGKYRKMIKQV